jgi:UTP-glucose-1-phosphate uridylyltransferase
MKKPSLLILAAGMGSRYGGLKQLDKVGPSGEAIIDYSIYDAIQAGFGKVVFVIRNSIEKDFKKFIGKKLKGKIDVEYVFQELDRLPKGMKMNPERKKPYGTGHAVLMAQDVIRENFAVVNADDFYGRDAFLTIAKYFKDNNTESYDNCMVGYQLKNTLSDHGFVSRGQCTSDKNNNLIEVLERTHIERKNGKIYFRDDSSKEHLMNENTLVSMNFWGFTPKFFLQLQRMFERFIKENNHNIKSEFYIPTVVNQMIKQKTAQTKVLESTASWFGVTYREDHPVVVEGIKNLVSKGFYPSNLWK